MIRALIIDDEPIARRRIRRLLKSERDIEIAGECSSGREALQVIEQVSPDLLLLDVQMLEMSGLELLTHLSKPRPIVIFTTAFDRYALQAFDLHALDYVLKPIDENRLREAVERARTQLRDKRRADADERLAEVLSSLKGKTAYADRLLVKQPGRAFFVKVEGIDWLEAADNYIRIHIGHEAHLVRDTMSEMERRLDPHRFVRVHRSAIVNVDRIKEIQSFFKGHLVLVLVSGQKLKLSRSYRENLEKIIGHAG